MLSVDAAQTIVQLADEPAPQAALMVVLVAHRTVHLRGQTDLFATACAIFANHLFALAPAIPIGGLDEIDPSLAGNIAHRREIKYDQRSLLSRPDTPMCRRRGLSRRDPRGRLSLCPIATLDPRGPLLPWNMLLHNHIPPSYNHKVEHRSNIIIRNTAPFVNLS